MCNVGAGSGPAWREVRGARSVPGEPWGGPVLQDSDVSGTRDQFQSKGHVCG